MQARGWHIAQVKVLMRTVPSGPHCCLHLLAGDLQSSGCAACWAGGVGVTHSDVMPSFLDSRATGTWYL